LNLQVAPELEKAQLPTLYKSNSG